LNVLQIKQPSFVSLVQYKATESLQQVPGPSASLGAVNTTFTL